MADKKLLQVISAKVAAMPDFEKHKPSLVASGCSNWVYHLMPDSVESRKYCLRIPRHEATRGLVVRGTTIQQALADMASSSVVPHVYHISSTFCIMEDMCGQPLTSWYEVRADLDRRSAILDGLASFFCTLWTTRISCSDQNATASYEYWLRGAVDKGLRRALTQQGSPWGDPFYFLLRRVQIPAMADGSDGDETGFVRHGDLNACNILIDSIGLTGVVDWDTAILTPLAATVHYPLFLADIPGWKEAGPETTDFSSDRQYLLEQIQKQVSNTCPAKLERISQLLHTSSERQFFEMSLSNKVINERYIEMRCRRDGTWANKEQLSYELGEFLTMNEDLRDSERINDLRKRLDLTQDFLTAATGASTQTEKSDTIGLNG